MKILTLFANSIGNMRLLLTENSILPTIYYLSTLGISKQCEEYYESLLTYARTTAYAPYLNDNQLELDLETDPLMVYEIKELLNTLKQVQKIFQELETLDISLEEISRRSVYFNLSKRLYKEIIPLFEKIQFLNHSIADMHYLLDNGIQSINPIFNTLQSSSSLLSEIHEKNKDKFANIILEEDSPLKIISKLSVILPYILQEMNQFIERGDTKIDFDPHAHHIKEEINNLHKKLKLINQDPSKFNRLNAWVKLSAQIKSIYTASFESGIELQTLLKARVEELTNYLPYCASELEMLEEKMGLAPGYLINAYFSGIYNATNEIRAQLSMPAIDETLYEDKMYELRVRRFAQYHSAVVNQSASRELYEFYAFLEDFSQYFDDEAFMHELSPYLAYEFERNYRKAQPWIAHQFPNLDIRIIKSLRHDETLDKPVNFPQILQTEYSVKQFHGHMSAQHKFHYETLLHQLQKRGYTDPENLSFFEEELLKISNNTLESVPEDEVLVEQGSLYVNQELFTRLKNIKISDQITAFEENMLMPWLYSWLTEENWNAVNQTLPYADFCDDDEAVLFYKELRTALFYLKKCCAALESVPELELGRFKSFSAAHQSYKILWPILGDGLVAQYQISLLLDNPRLKLIPVDFYNILEEIRNIAPFLKIKIQDGQKKPTQTIEPSSQLLWNKHQTAYAIRRRLASPTPTIIPPEEALSMIEPFLNENMSSLALQNEEEAFIYLLKKINHRYSAMFELEEKDDEYEKHLIHDIKTQFDEIAKKMEGSAKKDWYMLLNKLSQDVNKLSKISWKGPNPINAISDIIQSIKLTIHFLDNFSPLLQQLMQDENSREILRRFYIVLSIDLLACIDRIERISGFKPGILHQKIQVQELFETFFHKILISSDTLNEETIAIICDQSIYEYRLKSTHEHLTSLINQPLEREVQENIAKVDETYALLNALKTTLKKQKEEHLTDISEFLSCFEVLHPYLFKIDNWSFHKEGCLGSIHTKTQLLTVINKIIALQTKVHRVIHADTLILEKEKRYETERISSIESEKNRSVEKAIQKMLRFIFKEQNTLGYYKSVFLDAIYQEIATNEQIHDQLRENIMQGDYLLFEQNLRVHITKIGEKQQELQNALYELQKINDLTQSISQSKSLQLYQEKQNISFLLKTRSSLKPNCVYFERNGSQINYYILNNRQIQNGVLDEATLSKLYVVLPADDAPLSSAILKQLEPKRDEIIDILISSEHIRPNTELMEDLEKLEQIRSLLMNKPKALETCIDTLKKCEDILETIETPQAETSNPFHHIKNQFFKIKKALEKDTSAQRDEHRNNPRRGS